MLHANPGDGRMCLRELRIHLGGTHVMWSGIQLFVWCASVRVTHSAVSAVFSCAVFTTESMVLLALL